MICFSKQKMAVRDQKQYIDRCTGKSCIEYQINFVKTKRASVCQELEILEAKVYSEMRSKMTFSLRPS